MKQEEDFILREIQKISELIAKLLGRVSNQNLAEVDRTLKSQFDLSISDIINLNNINLQIKVQNLHNDHIEKLAHLIYKMILNVDDLNKNELANKAILMIDLVDEKSKTFSVERQNLKKQLLTYTIDQNL